MRSLTFLLVLLVCLPALSFAERITGEVLDISRQHRLSSVNVVNVHTNALTVSDGEGKFKIDAKRGELIEFRKMGYKTVRIRIPQGDVPPYFKIVMVDGPVELPGFDITNHKRDYKKDSVRYYELYKNALEFPELTGLDVIRHPFSAMSKRNRQIWAFQKEYAWWEQQKYIDYTFNEKLITDLTGLTGDSVQLYMKRYRPTYEQLRSMNEYTFYTYVKGTVDIFRHGRRYTPSIRRGAN